jgi:hypothetical protein
MIDNRPEAAGEHPCALRPVLARSTLPLLDDPGNPEFLWRFTFDGPNIVAEDVSHERLRKPDRPVDNANMQARLGVSVGVEEEFSD